MPDYPFVPAYHRYGRRRGPVNAFVVHMAEGGGTVGFLSRPNARGVSVHYVVEYTGRIVRMLMESEASGSINPNDLRTTEGPAPYGATVRKGVMGDWDHDPNSAVITCEVEGFARTGPTEAQSRGLVRLVDDVRSRYPMMGLLGHRDFQDYKPCPGGLIDWRSLGGHGPAGGMEDDPMDPFPIGVDRKLVTVRPGAQLYNLDLGTEDAPTVAKAEDAESMYTYRTGGVTYRVVVIPTGGVRHLWLVKPTDIVSADPIPPPDPAEAEVLPAGLYRVP